MTIKGSVMIQKYLITSTGGINANVFTSTRVSTGTSYLQNGPSTGKLWELHRFIVHLDCGNTVDPTKYGNDTAFGAGNGVVLGMWGSSSGFLSYFLGSTQNDIKSNDDWEKVATDFYILAYGAGNKHIHIVYKLPAEHKPITLDGDAGHKLRALFSSGTTGLNEHTMFVEGYEITK